MAVDVNSLGDKILGKLEEMSKKQEQQGMEAGESIGRGFDDGVDNSIRKINASAIKLSGAFNSLRGKVNKQLQQLASDVNGKKINLKIDFSNIDMNSDSIQSRIQQIISGFKDRQIIEFDTKGSEQQFNNLISLYVKYEEKLKSLKQVEAFSSTDDAKKNLQEQIVLGNKLKEIYSFLDGQTNVSMPYMRVGKIDDDIEKATSSLTKLEAIKEKVSKSDVNVGGVENIKEILEAINGIKESLAPISEMFKNEGNSLKTMAENGTTSFTTLSEAVNALYNNLMRVESAVDSISKKDFNINNITSIGVDSKGIERQQISKYRSAVSTMFTQITKEMIADLDASVSNSKGKNIDRSAMARAAFQIQEISQIKEKELTSTSIPKLQILFERLFDARNKIVKDLQQVATSTGTAFDSAKYSNDFKDIKESVPNSADMQAKADAAKNAAEQQKNLTNETNNAVSANKEILEYYKNIAEALNQIKLAIDPLSKAFSAEGSLFTQMATSGSSAMDMLIEKLKEAVSLSAQLSSTTSIHPEVKAEEYVVNDNGQIGFNLDANASNSAERTAQSSEKESGALKDVADSAKEAAKSKNEFVDANKKVKQSTEDSIAGILSEAAALEGVADGSNNVWTSARNGSSVESLNLPVEIVGENGQDAVKMFAMVKDQLEAEFNSPVKIKLQSLPNEDGELEAARATISFINEDLGVTVNQMYDIKRNEEGVLVATQAMENATLGATKEAKTFDAAMEKAVAKEKIETFRKQCGSIQIDLTNVAKAAEGIHNKASLNKFTSELQIVREKLKQVKSDLKGENTLDTIASAEKKLLTLPIQIDTLRKKLKPLMNLEGADGISSKLDEIMKSYGSFISSTDSDAKVQIFKDIVDNLSVAKSLMDNLKLDKSITEYDSVADRQVESYKKIIEYRQKLSSSDIGAESKKVIAERLKNEQKNFIQITNQLKSYNSIYDSANRVKVLEQARLSVLEKINAAQAKDADANFSRAEKQNANYGKSTFNSATRKYDNTMATYADMDDGVASPQLITAMDSYVQKYKDLTAARQKFINTPSLADNQEEKNAFNSTAQAVENARKKVQEYIDSISELNKAREDGTLLGQTEQYDPNGILTQEKAIQQYTNELFKGKLQITGWNDEHTKLYGTLNKGKGVIDNVTAAIDGGTNTLFAYRTATKETGTAWSQFLTGIKRKSKEISGYLIGAGSIYRAISELRKGIQYVKDIDLALTELKKVTDETDETYANFLKTASKTGAVIGSTVADFTNATANFARLGYSITEAAKLAEAASIYKNVGDGIDSVDQASESIISTMKAFGIEANNSMSIVDKFNEVGNNFAISSTGIGEALQRSASALYESGNTIDESIALITAANSVVNLCHVLTVM